MEFGYFTLSDNRYPNNPRAPEDFIKDIYAEALWAEKVGLHSAWIGEHHFNLLGVNASPLAILAQLAGATTRLRLAPAVTLLPVHHPLHVAEEWATLDLLSGGRVDFAAGRLQAALVSQNHDGRQRYPRRHSVRGKTIAAALVRAVAYRKTERLNAAVPG